MRLVGSKFRSEDQVNNAEWGWGPGASGGAVAAALAAAAAAVPGAAAVALWAAFVGASTLHAHGCRESGY